MNRSQISLLFYLAPALLPAQTLDPGLLLKPPTAAWPTYNGDYSGRRFSPLAQIDQSNINSLNLAWIYRLNIGETPGAIVGGEGSKAKPGEGSSAFGGPSIKATPLMVNGVLYFATPDNAWAVDARIRPRDLALLLEAPGRHSHRQSRRGNVRQLAVLRDARQLSGLARCKNRQRALACGNRRCEAGVFLHARADGGWQSCASSARAAIRWMFPDFSKRAIRKPASAVAMVDRAAEERRSGLGDLADEYSMRHGGGMTWMPGTYDPELNLYYVGTGNPNPVDGGAEPQGRQPWTCSIVALNADTGKLVWYFQASPHDTHDWDAAQTPVLIRRRD